MHTLLFSRFLALARTGLSTAVARAVSIALFIVSARVFTPHLNGGFILAMTIPQIASQLGSLGWLPLIQREISRISKVPSPEYKKFIILSAKIPTVSAILISLALVIFGFAFGGLNFYFLVAVATFCFSILRLLREYLLALKYPAVGTFITEAFPYAVAAILMWFYPPATVETALVYFIVGVSIATAIAASIVLPHVSPYISRDLGRETPACRPHRWLRSSMLAFLGSAGRALLDRLDVVVLSVFALSAQLAVYNSGLRITNLLLLPSVVLLPVFSPHISKAAKDGNIATLSYDMLLQTFLVSISALPFAVALFVYPNEIIGFLFGEEYGNVSRIIGFLIMSQIMLALSTPWSNLALMKDNEALYGIAHLIALVIAMAVALFLTAKLGAIAVAVAMMVSNTFLLIVFMGSGLLTISELRRA